MQFLNDLPHESISLLDELSHFSDFLKDGFDDEDARMFTSFQGFRSMHHAYENMSDYVLCAIARPLERVGLIKVVKYENEYVFEYSDAFVIMHERTQEVVQHINSCHGIPMSQAPNIMSNLTIDERAFLEQLCIYAGVQSIKDITMAGKRLFDAGFIYEDEEQEGYYTLRDTGIMFCLSHGIGDNHDVMIDLLKELLP